MNILIISYYLIFFYEFLVTNFYDSIKTIFSIPNTIEFIDKMSIKFIYECLNTKIRKEYIYKIVNINENNEIENFISFINIIIKLCYQLNIINNIHFNIIFQNKLIENINNNINNELINIYNYYNSIEINDFMNNNSNNSNNNAKNERRTLSIRMNESNLIDLNNEKLNYFLNYPFFNENEFVSHFYLFHYFIDMLVYHFILVCLIECFDN